MSVTFDMIKRCDHTVRLLKANESSLKVSGVVSSIVQQELRFYRPSKAYYPDFTEVEQDQPRYSPTSNGFGLVIEPGTFNLLKSSSNPKMEQVAVTRGSKHILTIYGNNSSVNIFHKLLESTSDALVSGTVVDLEIN